MFKSRFLLASLVLTLAGASASFAQVPNYSFVANSGYVELPVMSASETGALQFAGPLGSVSATTNNTAQTNLRFLQPGQQANVQGAFGNSSSLGGGFASGSIVINGVSTPLNFCSGRVFTSGSRTFNVAELQPVSGTTDLFRYNVPFVFSGGLQCYTDIQQSTPLFNVTFSGQGTAVVTLRRLAFPVVEYRADAPIRYNFESNQAPLYRVRAGSINIDAANQTWNTAIFAKRRDDKLTISNSGVNPILNNRAVPPSNPTVNVGGSIGLTGVNLTTINNQSYFCAGNALLLGSRQFDLSEAIFSSPVNLRFHVPFTLNESSLFSCTPSSGAGAPVRARLRGKGIAEVRLVTVNVPVFGAYQIQSVQYFFVSKIEGDQPSEPEEQ